MQLLAAFIALICLGTGAARAQSDSCKKFAQLVADNANNDCFWFWPFDALPDPNMPATAVCCNPAAIPWGESCIAPRFNCRVRASVSNETCLTCAKTEAAQPINLFTGNTYIAQSDISVPGLGGGLALTRVWNSMLPPIQSANSNMFGLNWRSNYEERLVFASDDGFMKYVRADGSAWSFGVAIIGSPNVFKVAAPATDTTTTITSGIPYWTLTIKSGERRQFDANSGVLVSIVDRNGNTTHLNYDSGGRLATVTDAAARHLYFNYPDGTSRLVSGVTSDLGLSVSYSYDGLGRLSQVANPNSTTVSFVYDGQSMITAVKDSDGKSLESHTYDIMGRGLTASRANDVDNVTITYPQ